MKLSTRSRYGTRMMTELAQNYGNAPIQTGEIARRQGLSVKYLEQLIIPLKKAKLITSTRGPKGGHSLTKPPEEITIGEIVNVLEGGVELSGCVENPNSCKNSLQCVTRGVWDRATRALNAELNSVALSELVVPNSTASMDKKSGQGLGASRDD